MAILKNTTALIIEPHASTRDSMQAMLNSYNIAKVDAANSSGTGIRQLRNNTYDIVLCEYDLAEGQTGQDGQQLLDDLRTNKIIPLSTIFMIVTAESDSQKIIGAAELTPTDYILKPFTAAALLTRLERAIARRTIFMPTYKRLEQGRFEDAISSCKLGEEEHPKFATDFLRLRADIHISIGQLDNAALIYQALIESKPLAWARLGLAKIHFQQDRYAEAEKSLTELLQDNTKYLEAYDYLAKTLEANGNIEGAKSVLERAVAVSPHGIKRLRKLGQVALETGDIGTAERAFQQVLSKAKYSEFRDPEDHFQLVKTLVTKGDTRQAATIIRDLEKSSGGQNAAKVPTCKAFSDAMVHDSNGNKDLAISALNTAVLACRNSPSVSTDLKMSLAKSCLENKLDDNASEVMLEVMSNTASPKILAKAISVFEEAGRSDLAENISKESKRLVIELVSAGAKQAKLGDYRGAVDLMANAALKFPNNPQVIFNAAVAALKCLERVGWDRTLCENARWYIDNARRLDPTNTRLVQLDELYMTILTKNAINPAQINIKAPKRS